MLNSQIVIIVILEALDESQLLHSNKILLRETKLVFVGRIEFIDVCCVPSELVVGYVEFYLLAGDVEMGRVGDRNKVN